MHTVRIKTSLSVIASAHINNLKDMDETICGGQVGSNPAWWREFHCSH